MAEESFGRYRLLGEIARGGMGIVYRAVDPQMGREVALKVMTSGSDDEVARFEREVRIAAQLSHPNVVRIYDVGREDGRPYYTMELVEGPSLARLLEKHGRLAPRTAARLVLEAARGLEAAHAKGVVHRDIKPGNILLVPGGADPSTPEDHRALLADFGLARDLDATRKLTLTGNILGTPAYMSPEQARGEPVDARSDVYSLAAVLYEALSGRMPFDADNVNALLLKVIRDDPPSLPREIAAGLRSVIEKGMEKDPARRYASAAPLAEDLERYLRGEEVVARPAGRLRRARRWAGRHRALATFLATAAAAVVAAGAYFLGPAWVEVHGETTLVWPAGRRSIAFARDGYERQETELTVAPWRTTSWTAPLVKDHGFLRVRTEPPGAEVVLLVDGRPRLTARADADPIRAPRGTHAILVCAADHEELSAPVHVPSGETVEYAYVLRHETGFLSATAFQEGVRLTVAGKTWTLPSEPIELPTGTHQALFELDNHFAVLRSVSIARAGPRTRGGAAAEGQREPGVAYVHATLDPMERWSAPIDGWLRPPVALADLDDDGCPDLVAGSTEGVLAVSGRAGEVLWRTLAGVARVAGDVIDADGDGAPDVVALSEDGALCAISGRDGRVLWRRRIGSRSAEAPAIADLDADGTREVIAAAGGTVIAVRCADGGVVWERTSEAALSDGPAIGDLDGDGHPEVALATEKEVVLALSGRDGAPLWRSQALNVTDPATVGDIDGDGRADLVFGSMLGRVQAFSGSTGRVLWTAVVAAWAHPPVLVDLDGDGAVECVFSSDEPALHVLSARDGKEQWSLVLGGRVDAAPLVVDLDGDGGIEIVLADDQGAIESVSPIDHAIRTFYRGQGAAAWVGTADLDGDSHTECLAATGDRGLLALSTKPTPHRWAVRLPAYVSVDPWAADLDRDGAPECVVPTVDGSLHAYSGTDGAKFWTSRDGGYLDRRAGCADLDGEGTADLLVRGRDSRLQAVSGATGSRLWSAPTVANPWCWAFVSDLDGATGIVAGDLNGRVVALSGRDGRERWAAALGGMVASLVTVRDLDGDACPDVVASLRGDQAAVVAISSRRGDVLWRARVSGLGDKRLAVGDLDGDGVEDILAVVAEHTLLAISGAAREALWRWSEPAALVASDPVVGDLDADGKLEVVVSRGDGEVYARSGRDGSELWSFHVGTWARPLLADLDGDGASEVVVSHLSRTWVLDGRDGQPRLEAARLGHAVPSGRGLFAMGQDLVVSGPRVVVSIDAVLSRAPLARLAEYRAWRALQARADEELRARPGDARALRFRGLARLRLGDARRACDDFREASRLGWRPPEMVADWLEACAHGQVVPDLPDVPVEAAVLLLEPPALLERPRLSGDERAWLSERLAPRTPAALVVAGRSSEAIDALSSSDPRDPIAAATRGWAYREQGDLDRARLELEFAVRALPGSRVFRRALDSLGR